MPLQIGSQTTKQTTKQKTKRDTEPSEAGQTPPMKKAVHKHIVWQGSCFASHSLARTNRELTLALLENGAFDADFVLTLLPQKNSEPALGTDRTDVPLTGKGAKASPVTKAGVGGKGKKSRVNLEPAARFLPLSDRMKSLVDAPAKPAVTIRNGWPMDFSKPKTGRLVILLSWEFGSLPMAWVDAIDRNVDEVWVPTITVRDACIRSGVPEEKVQIVPAGVDGSLFNPGAAPFDFTTRTETRELGAATYKFLFTGGLISRCGGDSLLQAYANAFTTADDVALIITGRHADEFYACDDIVSQLERVCALDNAPRIIHLAEPLTDAEAAAMIAACDCIVHPAHVDATGLAVREAMACGKPPMMTGFGAAMEFASADNAFPIPTTFQLLAESKVDTLPTVERSYWLTADSSALAASMRYVFEHPDVAADKSVRAAQDAAGLPGWQDAAASVVERLGALTESLQVAAYGTMVQGDASTDSSVESVDEDSSGIASLFTAGARYESAKQNALGLTRAGDWNAARAALRDCLEERPNDWELVNALAVVYYRTDEMQEALDLLRRGVETAPEVRDLHHNLAFILLVEDRCYDALEYALNALAFTPDQQDIRDTVTRAQEGVLTGARALLRGVPDRQRAQVKQSEAYRNLMQRYRQAEAALHPQEASPIEAQAVHVESEAPRISLCMIVKNEERFLRQCLESARDDVDEIIIVDTGSTDGTLEIAREFGAKIVSCEWTDDFAAARNVSLKHATGNWALWLDADEEIAPDARGNFRKAVAAAAAHSGAYTVRIKNWITSYSRDDSSEVIFHSGSRLFRLLPGVRFQGRIHEQNLPSLEALGFYAEYLEGLMIDHFGYVSEVIKSKNKHERTISMLLREVEDCPNKVLRSFQLFNLGIAYVTGNDPENAAKYLTMAAENPDTGNEYTTVLFYELALALDRLSRSEEGLVVCRQADELGIQHSGVEFARGYCHRTLKQYEEAEQAFRTALEYGKRAVSPHATTGDAGLLSYKSHYALAMTLAAMHRPDEAFEECERALAITPTFYAARYLMAGVLTDMKRLDEAAEALRGTIKEAPEHYEAVRDLAGILMVQEAYADALPFLQTAVQLRPTLAVNQTRLALCAEGLGDRETARAAYEALRDITPDSAEVAVNLGRLLSEDGETAAALDCFTDAIQINPKYSNAYFNAGDLLYRLGVYDRAAETYMAGLEVAPRHPAGFFMLGNCCFQNQDYAAAVVSYRQALVEDPQNASVKHNLEMAQEYVTLSEPVAQSA